MTFKESIVVAFIILAASFLMDLWAWWIGLEGWGFWFF